MRSMTSYSDVMKEALTPGPFNAYLIVTNWGHNEVALKDRHGWFAVGFVFAADETTARNTAWSKLYKQSPRPLHPSHIRALWSNGLEQQIPPAKRRAWFLSLADNGIQAKLQGWELVRVSEVGLAECRADVGAGNWFYPVGIRAV